jgi:hypothetical protein
VTGGALRPGEAEAYIKMAREAYPDKNISAIDIKIDGEYVDMTCRWKEIPFTRLRRITGYLGTLDHFNNGKRAEERERVKHGVDDPGGNEKSGVMDRLAEAKNNIEQMSGMGGAEKGRKTAAGKEAL